MTLKTDLYLISKRETEKYILEQMLQKINYKKDENWRQRNSFLSQKKRNEDEKPKIQKDFPDFELYVLLFIIIIALSKLIIKDVLIVRLIIYGVTFFLMRSDYSDKEKAAQEYRKKKKNYLDNKSKYEKEISRLQSEYNYYDKIYVELRKEILDVDSKLAFLYRKANIYYKYRNLVAMCTIYEYIASGICSELEGSKGAYKFFEEQAMRGYIVSSIQQANRENLRRQQFLESSIEKANRELSSMESNLKAVDRNYAQINQTIKKITGKQ